MHYEGDIVSGLNRRHPAGPVDILKPVRPNAEGNVYRGYDIRHSLRLNINLGARRGACLKNPKSEIKIIGQIRFAVIQARLEIGECVVSFPDMGSPAAFAGLRRRSPHRYFFHFGCQLGGHHRYPDPDRKAALKLFRNFNEVLRNSLRRRSLTRSTSSCAPDI